MWHARRRCVYMKNVGRRCDHEDLHGQPENYIDQGRFQLGQNEAEKQRGFTEKPYHHPYVWALSLSLWLSLSLPMHTFWVIKGKEKKQIIFLYISIVVFLCYTKFVILLVNVNIHSYQFFYQKLIFFPIKEFRILFLVEFFIIWQNY